MPNCRPFSEPYRRFYSLLLLAAVVAAAWMAFHLDGHTAVVCPSKLLLHVPCPGCGMTRAVTALLHGDLAAAVYFNVNCLVLLPFLTTLGLLVAVDLLSGRVLAYRLWGRVEQCLHRRLVFGAIIVVEVMVEIHNIVCSI